MVAVWGAGSDKWTAVSPPGTFVAQRHPTMQHDPSGAAIQMRQQPPFGPTEPGFRVVNGHLPPLTASVSRPPRLARASPVKGSRPACPVMSGRFQ